MTSGAWKLALLAVAALLIPAAAAARERVSVVYCEDFTDGGAAFFAAKERPDGALEFSFSNWMPSGNRASIGGTAQRHGDAWVYRSMENASKPGRPCVAHIRVDGKAGARITAEPLDACDGNQGHRASIGSVDFPAGAYGGPAPNDEPNVNEDDLGPIC